MQHQPRLDRKQEVRSSQVSHAMVTTCVHECCLRDPHPPSPQPCVVCLQDASGSSAEAPRSAFHQQAAFTEQQKPHRGSALCVSVSRNLWNPIQRVHVVQDAPGPSERGRGPLRFERQGGPLRLLPQTPGVSTVVYVDWLSRMMATR